METDPMEGTPAVRVIEGLGSYLDSKGYAVSKLEVAGWRTIGSANAGYSIGLKPTLAWLRSSIDDEASVVLLNVGWYKEAARGYTRDGGHWVVATGTGPKPNQFHIHNSLLASTVQKGDNSVTLTRLGDSFDRIISKGKTANMAGYYKVKGSGLPFGGKTAYAVLDCAIRFTAKK